MKKTTVRMFLKKGTKTAPRGWYSVLLVRLYPSYWSWGASIASYPSTVKNATTGRIENINRNNIGLDISRFSTEE